MSRWAALGALLLLLSPAGASGSFSFPDPPPPEEYGNLLINRAAVELTQRAIETGERQPAYEVECISRTWRKVLVEVN